MDGRRRAIDNIYIERFWRSIKYEKIYLNPPNGGVDLRNHVHEYIKFYNSERRHTEIGKVPPDELYFKKKVASKHQTKKLLKVVQPLGGIILKYVDTSLDNRCSHYSYILQ